ncbi:MAG: alanine dehydrogenase [Moraxellaceae bacterium]|nr:MAG: alanine dehydrogenase [Moraxellaceae bacterium]
MYPQKDGSTTWEFVIEGIYEVKNKSIDTSTMFFHYDYFDKARQYGEGTLGWLIVKVKELQPEEFPLLKPHHRLFSYLHLAAEPELTQALMKSGATCIAFETLRDSAGRLPLLAPMSEIAGRLSVQMGAQHLCMAEGGRGVLLGGVPGISPAKVVVLGGGVVGTQAAQMAIGLGAQVTIVDKSLHRLRELDAIYRGRLFTEFSTQRSIEELVKTADLVIGAVLIIGASAPKLIKRSQLSTMPKGSVLVDVAIDQGGCFESSRPTTHLEPTYVEDGVVHYCVTNIPSAVARTASMALSNALLPYVLQLAALSNAQLLRETMLHSGINVYGGDVCHTAVAESLGLNAKTLTGKNYG